MYCLIYRAQVREGYEHEFIEAWTELVNNVQQEVSGDCYRHLQASDTRPSEYTVYTRWPCSTCINLQVFKDNLNEIKQQCIYFELLHESNLVYSDFVQHANRTA